VQAQAHAHAHAPVQTQMQFSSGYGALSGGYPFGERKPY
jgi:hypothetical protein